LKHLDINWPNQRFSISSKDKKFLLFKDFIETKNFKKIKW